MKAIHDDFDSQKEHSNTLIKALAKDLDLKI
jgi:hypothetical protein